MKRMRVEARWYSERGIPGMEDYYESRAKLLKALDVSRVACGSCAI